MLPASAANRSMKINGHMATFSSSSRSSPVDMFFLDNGGANSCAKGHVKERIEISSGAPYGFRKTCSIGIVVQSRRQAVALLDFRQKRKVPRTGTGGDVQDDSSLRVKWARRSD